jgi:hypothetical protein
MGSTEASRVAHDPHSWIFRTGCGDAWTIAVLYVVMRMRALSASDLLFVG